VSSVGGNSQVCVASPGLDVYIDTETDEAQFGTVKEGFIERHLAFVPLTGVTIGPDALSGIGDQTKQVKDAPNIHLEGDELSQADESALYHHFQLKLHANRHP